MSDTKKPKKQSKTDLLQQRVKELEEDLKRAQADSFNIKRRAEEDKTRIGSFAKREVILALLPAIDNLERAIATASDEDKQSEYFKGLLSVRKQINNSFTELGVSRIKTIGEVFDPEKMEAVAVEGEGDTEIVSEELQAGYDLADYNLRHAIVKVTRS